MLLFLAISIAVLSAVLVIVSGLIVSEWDRDRNRRIALAGLVTLFVCNPAFADNEAKLKAKAKALALLAFSEPVSIVAPQVVAPGGWLTDYTAAQRTAAATGRPLLVYLTIDPCPYCVQMERTTFVSSAVRKALAECVTTKLDAKDAAGLVKALKVTAYPTFVLAAPDGTILRSATGYMAASSFVDWLRTPPKTVPVKAGASVTPLAPTTVVVVNGCGCNGDPDRCTCQVCRCQP